MPKTSAEAPRENTTLTTGLRRFLIGATVVVGAMAAVQIVSVIRLQAEIEHWDWIAEVDSIRESLMARTQFGPATDRTGTAAPVVAAFDTLRAIIAERAELSEERIDAARHGVAKDLALLESEARGLFDAAREREAMLEPLYEDLKASEDALQDLSGKWATQLSEAELGLLQRSRQIDMEQRRLNDLKTSLIASLLSVQSMQQQILAIDRLAETNAPPDLLASMIQALDAGKLPEPCSPGEIEGTERICTPNITRVANSLEDLLSSNPDDIPGAVRRLVWAMEGYLRALGTRETSIASELSQTLNEARAVQDNLTELRRIGNSITRVNRLILDLEVQIDASIASGEDLEIADNRVNMLIAQLQFRIPGLLSIAPFLEDDATGATSHTASIREDWTRLREVTSERIEFQNLFQATMTRLSADIAFHARETRQNTTVWVGIYTTTFIILALGLGALVFWVVWMARSRFLVPLSRVTQTILGLSEGNLGQPFLIEQRAFGFDKLGEAVELLRQDMLERQALAIENEEQQRIIARNLAELSRTSEEMEWLAMHDTLTGLGNRRQADADIAKTTKVSAEMASEFCVMQVDVDRFKDVNDALGHAAGDHVLSHVAGILKTTCGSDATCYRIGGDEFLVIFQQDLSEAAAQEIASTLIARVEAPIEYEGRLIRVGTSIGIAFGSEAEGDASVAVLNADLALYSAKRSEENRYCFFTSELANRSRERRDLSDRIRAAIDDRAFVPYYQPQFLADGLNIRGVEVLCRWHDPAQGWVPPSSFLGTAEDLGLVGLIDEILFEKVVSDVETLHTHGLTVPRVSFNVTLDRLLKADLAARLAERLGEDVTIALELLESMSLDNPSDSVAWAIDTLKESGIEIEIDDFGSYRASLAGLMAVNPCAMKIDRAIVQPITSSQRHLNLVKKIIDIGAALNIEVVAEGVETGTHTELLRSLGCDSLQGFGLAKPMPFDDLMEFCRQRPECHRTTNAVA